MKWRVIKKNEEMKLKTFPELEAPINNNVGFKDFRDSGYMFR